MDVNNLLRMAQLMVITPSVLALVGGIAFFYRDITNALHAVPQIQQDVQELKESQVPNYRIIEYLGTPLVTTTMVKAGEPIHVLLRVRANVNCERTIEYRFWNATENKWHPGVFTSAAVRSAVSDSFQILPVPIVTPDDLEVGHKYSYVADVLPKECGVYGRQQIGPSTLFRVVE